MANWATIFRQSTRLPVLPAGVDPRTDWFYCEPFQCKLPKTGCANRHRLSQQRTTDGISYQAVTYGACRNCNVGAAHARGDPTPPFATELTTMTEATTATPTTEKPEATNGRLKPLVKAKPKPRHKPKRPARKMVPAPPAMLSRRADGTTWVKPTAASMPPNGTRASTPQNGHDPLITAYDWLEMGGYSVTRIYTPGGEFLRVS